MAGTSRCVQSLPSTRSSRADLRPVQTTLFADSFPLVDFLIPLLAADDVHNERAMTTSDCARSCSTLVATVCSPKEVVMAVEQEVAELVEGGFDNSSDDDEDGTDARDSACRLSCLTTMYASGACSFPSFESADPSLTSQDPARSLDPHQDEAAAAVPRLGRQAVAHRHDRHRSPRRLHVAGTRSERRGRQGRPARRRAPPRRPPLRALRAPLGRQLCRRRSRCT